jgi:hypothetical protein
MHKNNLRSSGIRSVNSCRRTGPIDEQGCGLGFGLKMTLAGHRGDVARLKIRHRRKPNFGHLRRFHPRTKGVGLRLRHGFQEAFDGLASDDLAVTREHPIRNVSVLKLDEIAFSFSRQIVWHLLICPE